MKGWPRQSDAEVVRHLSSPFGGAAGPWGREATPLGRFLMPGLWQRLDFVILLVTGLLLLIGRLFIESASYLSLTGTVAGYATRQVQWIVLSMFVLFVTVAVRYTRAAQWSVVLYLLMLGALLYTLYLGDVRKNSRRWIMLTDTYGMQPSEFVKPVLILCLAQLLRFRRRPGVPRSLLLTVVLTLIPALLIAAQPDLATALLLFPIAFAMAFVAGARIRSFVILAVVGLLSILPIYVFALHDYQRERIKTFVFPGAADKAGEGYQVDQSIIMIGSGGVFGKGLGEGPQNRLNYLPERHTDFIFSVVGEEWGFVGCLLVLGLFWVLVLACLGVALRIREPCGRLIAVGVATSLAIPVFVNTAMTVGAAPTTGVPLPLVSYGGSSLLSHMVGIGLVLNVNLRKIPVIARGDFGP